jgi:hypothetical protein
MLQAVAFPTSETRERIVRYRQVLASARRLQIACRVER